MPFRRSDRPRPTAARLPAAVRTVVELLEVRCLLSGSAPDLQPAHFAVHGDQLAFSSGFADADAGESHTATADWGDGSPAESLTLDQPGTFTAAGSDAGLAYGLHRYAALGLRTVRLTLRDAAGHTTAQQFAVLVGQADDQPAVGPTAPTPGTAGGDSLSPDGFDQPTTAEAGEEPTDTTPPVVQAVFLDNAGWSPAFRDFLQAHGLGSSAYGFAVPAGTGQTTPLPWVNLNRVSVQFSENVTVDVGDLSLYGVNTDTYALAASNPFTYDPGTFTATWTLAASLPADRLLIDLDGDSAGAVADGQGNPLDGTWANADAGQSFPSGGGNGAGTDFEFRLDVLPGDDYDRNGQVDAFDTLGTRAREGSDATTNTANYSAFHDVDGSGAIDSFDTLAVRDRQATRLPAATTPGVPAAPTGLTATAVGADRIDLGWADHSDRENGFRIELSFDGVDFVELTTVPANSTTTGTFSWTSAFPNTVHYFRIAATNAGFDSAFSNTASARTAPAAPQELTATGTSTTEVDLTWAAPTEFPSNSTIADQVLERRADGATTWQPVVTLGQSDGSYSDTGLTEGTRYEYRLRWDNATGTSPWSELDEAYTLPAGPTGLTATAETDADPSIQLQWTDLSGGESEFVVEGSTDDGATWREFARPAAQPGSGGVASYLASGLALATTYLFRVSAANAAGQSVPSATASAATRTWLTHGEASVTINGTSSVIRMGVADRLESGSQEKGVHGASLLLKPAASYQVAFSPDLKTWDSYNASSPGSNTGYWDSFSVSVTDQPYWELPLSDPLDPARFPFVWGGSRYGDGTLETYTTAQTLTITGDPTRAKYLNVVLDTNTTGSADGAFPSWGTVTLTSPAILPVVSVRATKPQAAEGGSADAQGEFTFYREGGDISKELTANYTIGTGGATAGSDYTQLSGSVTFGPNERSKTVKVEGLPDTDATEGNELVTLFLTSDPDKYGLGQDNVAAVTILDRKRYIVSFYGLGGPNTFGDEWLDKLLDRVRDDEGYAEADLIRKTHQDRRPAQVAFFEKINADPENGKVISAAEAESADVRVVGYSLGGPQAINFAYDVRQPSNDIADYKIEAAVPIKALVVLDPVEPIRIGNFRTTINRAKGPVPPNVKKFRNYYQQHPQVSQFTEANTGAKVKVGGDLLAIGAQVIQGSDFAVDASVADKDQFRIDTDARTAGVNVQRDRISAGTQVVNPLTNTVDPDPLINGHPGENIWEMSGSKANHLTLVWYVYGRAKDDLS